MRNSILTTLAMALSLGLAAPALADAAADAPFERNATHVRHGEHRSAPYGFDQPRHIQDGDHNHQQLAHDSRHDRRYNRRYDRRHDHPLAHQDRRRFQDDDRRQRYYWSRHNPQMQHHRHLPPGVIASRLAQHRYSHIRGIRLVGKHYHAHARGPWGGPVVVVIDPFSGRILRHLRPY